jgi:SET domain-containing protein
MSNKHTLLDLVFVKDSTVHGKGLFAKVAIKKGSVIGTLEGKSVQNDGLHVLWMNDGTEKFKVTNELKFINHHKKPNVVYYDDYTVVALKKITADSELLHDYGDDWD